MSRNLPRIPDDEIDIAAFVRAFYSRHAIKRFARLMDVPIGTARHWLYEHFPAQRREQAARVLLPEIRRCRQWLEQSERRFERLARGRD
jgi:hypothetical protein